MDTKNQSMSSTLCLFVLLALSSVIISGATTVGQDLWISSLLAGVLFLPVGFMCVRVCCLFPGKNLYNIIPILFNKPISTFLTCCIVGYAVVVSALVLRNFVEFTIVISLQFTPRIVIMMSVGIVAVYLAKSGLRVFEKWIYLVTAIMLMHLVFTAVLAIDTIDVNNIYPIMDHSLKDVLLNGYLIGSIAVGEMLFIPAIFSYSANKKYNYRGFMGGILLGMMFLTLTFIRNLLILGAEMIKAATFTSYMATRIIHFGSFFERIESIISFVLLLLGMTKIALCLAAAAKGTASLLDVEDYRRLIIPLSLLVVAICSIIFKNMYEMFEFAGIYAFVALPFQLLIPLTIWIKAEMAVRKGIVTPK